MCGGTQLNSKRRINARPRLYQGGIKCTPHNDVLAYNFQQNGDNGEQQHDKNEANDSGGAPGARYPFAHLGC